MTNIAPNFLHKIAALEAQKKISRREIELSTNQALENEIDIHQVDENGDTAFNIAAPSSPIIGRLLTNHWLKLALRGEGKKGLNDLSGSHNSSLAQYIAKWSNAEEISKQLDDGIRNGMNIAVQNSSGWTPLHAACAMAYRFHALQAFALRYDQVQLNLRTSEVYETTYSESPEVIFYNVGLTALEVSKARVLQAKTLAEELKFGFNGYVRFLSGIGKIEN